MDGEVVEEDHQPPPSQELVRVDAQGQPGQVTLFGTSDPAEVVERAAKVAGVLKDILKTQGLTTRIGNKDHVQVEGWQTLGTMVGVFPHKEWVEELPYPDPLPEGLKGQKDKGLKFGYKASYRVQTLNGAVVGGAEAECNRTEKSPWTWGADYALKSMAQTRAQSKALGSALRFIITMAGYSGTPAEEMEHEAPKDASPKYGAAISKEQAESLANALVYLTGSAQDATDVYASVEKDAGYMPNIAARAILHTARKVRDNVRKNMENEDQGSSEDGE